MKASMIILSISLASCGTFGDSKFVRKEIPLNEGTLKWYYYSYITSISPDIVEVERNGIQKEIYKANWVIANVKLQGDSIILKLFEPSKGIVFTKEVENQVLGYKIILDSSATYKDLQLRPKGAKE